jgi:alpha-D-xyloside xylohydrolase
MMWDDAGRTLTIGKREGAFAGMAAERTVNVVLVRPGKAVGIGGIDKADRTMRYSGEAVAVKF